MNGSKHDKAMRSTQSMLKKGLMVLLSILLVIVPMGSFAAALECVAVITDDGVTISGAVSQSKLPVTLTVILAEDDVLDLDQNSDKILKLSQTLSGDDGRFAFNIAFNDNVKGKDLIARVNIPREGVIRVPIHILSDDEITALYNEFMETSDIENFLGANKTALSIDLSVLTELRNPSKVYDYIYINKSEIKSVADIAEKFLEAYITQKETERQEDLDKEAIDALNASSKDTFLSVLGTYNDRYGLDITKQFGLARVKSAGNTAVKNVWAKVYKADSIESLKNLFAEAVATEVINVVSYTEMERAIDANSILFTQMLTGDFGDLTSVNKSEIYKAAVDVEFDDTNEINNWFETKASDYAGSDDKVSGSKGGNISFYTPGKPAQTGSLVPPEAEENPVRFADIDENFWAGEAINYLAQKEIISGTGNGSFEPYRNVTREEFTKMLILANDLMVDYAVPTFDDAARHDWFYPYVASAQNTGIVTGYSADCFGVGDNITRQDMAVLIYRAFLHKGTELKSVRDSITFFDDAEIDDYAKDAVYSLYKAGIINGFDNGSFGPGKYATRAEAAKMLFESIK